MISFVLFLEVRIRDLGETKAFLGVLNALKLNNLETPEIFRAVLCILQDFCSDEPTDEKLKRVRKENCN